MDEKTSATIKANLVVMAVLLVGVIVLPLTPVAGAQQAPEPKRILVLFWDDRGSQADDTFAHNFQSVVESAPAGTVEYYSEYLESNRFPGENQSLLVRDYLRKKYSGRKINVVVAAGGVPLDFLLKYRKDLFSNTPIVFLATKRPTASQLDSGPGMTGLIILNAYKQTLDLALSLHPGTNNVFIVSGSLDHDKEYETLCREELRNYETPASIEYLTDLTPADLSDKVRRLPARSLVLYIWQQSRSEEGKILETSDVLALIAPATTAPIYGIANWQVGRGVVGGYVRTVEINGERTAQFALRVANGERPQDIPVENVPVVPMFDSRELRRWGIDEESLPPDSILQFRLPSFWDEYKWYAIAVLSVLVLQSVLIAGLVVNRSLRRRAEVEREKFASQADADRRRLNEILSHMPGLVWESLLQPDGTRKAIFVNQYAEKMVGYSPEEWLTTPNFSQVIAHEDDRETIDRGIAEVVKSGKDHAMQFRWLTKDGRLKWVESHLAALRDGSGQVVGLRGITLDITDRKLADESLRSAEERNRAILRAIPDLMFLNTVDGVYLDYQANDPDDLLVPPSEFLGKNIRDVLPAELSEGFLVSFRRAQETDEPQSVEYMLPLNDKERWFEARIVTTQGDKVLSVVRDITDRKLAEAALKENEAKLGGIVGSAMDAIISIDQNQRIVLFNAAAETMFGRAAADVIGRSIERFIPEDFRQAHQTHIRAFGDANVTKRSMGAPGGLFGLRANGEQFPIEASISQLKLHGQKFYTVILRDITKRRQATDALHEAQESLTIALEASQMGTWDLDLTKDFSGHRSLRHDQIFGYDTPQADWGREVARRHIVEEDRAIFDAAFARAMVTGDLDFEARVRWKDGTVHWMAVRGRFYFDENGKPTRGAGVNYDITARKSAEEAVRESEERFRTMADTAPVMIWVAGADKLCNYFNQQWLNFTGRSMEQEIGNRWTEGVHLEDVGRCLEIYNKAFDRRDSFTMEYRLKRADGEFRWVLDTGTARFSAGAEFLGYIGSCIDITERKAAEEALANFSGQLIRAREDECARIARELHDDVNQRMALVSIDLERLGKRTDTPDALRRELTDLLSQLTDTSREIHRMSRDLHPSKLVLLGLVPTLKSLFEELHQRHGLRIKFTGGNLPTNISQDVSLCLYRTVQECLNNVIKHSGAEACAVELREGVNELRLRVSDAGAGFDIESSSIKMGLGLISMRERLRLVGGSISIESRPSLGTRIDARVPLGRVGLEYADTSEKEKPLPWAVE